MENNKNFKKNLLIVGLSSKFIQLVANQISEKFDFYYLDVENLLEYSLMNVELMKKVCGKKYLTEQESKIITSLNDYENTLMSMKLDTFIANYNILNKNIIKVYFAVEKNQIKELDNLFNSEIKTESFINELLFEEHDKFLKKNCDIVLKCDIYNIEKSFDELILKINS